jgi:hypothetical protein
MAPEQVWYNDDSFWLALEPFMFTKERWEGTPDEVDLLLELVEAQEDFLWSLQDADSK